MIMRENERLTVARYLSYPLRSRLSNNSFLNEAPRDSPPRFRESISSSPPSLSVSLFLESPAVLIPTHSATCAGYYAYFNGRDFHPRGTTPSNFHRGQKWMEWRVETIEQARVQNPMGRGGRREELFPSTVYHRILYILISSTRFEYST